MSGKFPAIKLFFKSQFQYFHFLHGRLITPSGCEVNFPGPKVKRLLKCSYFSSELSPKDPKQKCIQNQQLKHESQRNEVVLSYG